MRRQSSRTLLTSFRSPIKRAVELLGRARKRRNRRRAEVELIRQSHLFDAEWYLATYPDVATAGIDPAVHFLDCGWREGRDPSAGFCSTEYLRRHADVAERGVNPLLHFIEYGSFEGRDVEGVGDVPARPSRRAPRRSLPPDMPVFSQQRPVVKFYPWLRACNLADRDGAVELDGLGMAIVRSADRAAINAVIADFQALSGKGRDLSPEITRFGEFPAAQDLWFTSSNRLLARWNLSEPAVIRGLQLDPAFEHLAVVGEGLATCPLDVIEFDLASPFLPILLLAVAPDGELRGVRSFAFPSLARAGAHYSELVDILGSSAELGPLDVSSQLEAKLRLMRTGHADPVVNSLVMNLSGADGAGPCFRQPIRDWLERIVGVSVAPEAGRSPQGAEAYLMDAIRLKVANSFRSTGSKLVLAPDMIPTVRILTAVQGRGSEVATPERDQALGLIVCDPDHSQPAVAFMSPLGSLTVDIESGCYPIAFPRMRSVVEPLYPAAIRTIDRKLDDAEYMFPDLSAQPDPKAATTSISWLIDWSDGEEMLLAQSLTALARQEEIGAQGLCFLRPTSRLVRQVAETSFGGRWTCYGTVSEAIAANQADLLGYLGQGTVLHDSRSAALLATLLENPAVSTASCALVASSRHGESWRTAVADGGHIPIDREIVFGGRMGNPAEMLWRSVYAATQPPSRFWVARSATANSWLSGGTSDQEQIHLVTSLVTASLEQGGRKSPAHDPFGPPRSERRSIRARILAG